jgi:hypothetical protein
MGGRELTKRDRAELERIRDDPKEPRFNRILANEVLAQHGIDPIDLDESDTATGECACCIGYICPQHGGEE